MANARNSNNGDFNPSYFEHVLAEYELLNADENIPSKVQKIIHDHENGLSPKPADLYLLEKYVIHKQPEDVVRARLTSLRQNYRGIFGADAYAEYLESGQASQPTSDFKAVKADAGRLLDTLQWSYAMVPECEEKRTEILKKIGFEMVFSVAIGLAIVLGSFYMGQTLVSAVVLVMLMGALGGFLSVQQRIAKISTEQDPILTMFQLQRGLFAVRLAPLTGALCALVMFLIFQAGLLTGTLFPTMTGFDFHLGDMQGPGAIEKELIGDFAKLLVWCFIAGFAERFVPDTLDKLIARQEHTEKGKVPLTLPQSNPGVKNGNKPRKGTGSGSAQQTADDGQSEGKIILINKGHGRHKGKGGKARTEKTA